MNKIPIKLINEITPGSNGTGQLSFDGKIDTGWFSGWNPSNYPAKIVVDLGKEYNLEKIRYFDGPGEPTIGFQIGDFEILKFKAVNYQSWQEKILKVKTRYVQVTIYDIQGQNVIPEIEFWTNDPIEDVPVDPTPSPDPINDITFDQFVGMNGFDWIPPSAIPFKQFRMYGMLEWMWTGPGGRIKIAPSKRGDVNYDDWLKKMKDLGINVLFCPNKIPGWFTNENPNNWGEWMDQRFCDPKTDGTKPEHYLEYAKFVFQIAARYGKTKHPVSELNVDQTQAWEDDDGVEIPYYSDSKHYWSDRYGQISRFANTSEVWSLGTEPINQPLSGLDLLQEMEIENEPDRPWKSAQYKYTPQQFAALYSAAVDGHCGTMGPGVGGKLGCPFFKIRPGGLSAINQDYFQGMLTWFRDYRPDGKWPGEEPNLGVHWYFNKSNDPYPGKNINLVNGAGIAPERDDLYERLRDLRQWRDRNLSKATIYFSEFGYDTLKPTPVLSQFPELYGSHSAQELQAWWLLRTILISIEVGIDRVMIYNGIDENNPSGLFTASGLSSGQYPYDGSLPFKPKIAYTFLKKFVDELNGYKFKGIQLSSNKKIAFYQFTKEGFDDKFVYWSPSWNDSIVIDEFQGKSIQAKEEPQILTLLSSNPIQKYISIDGSDFEIQTSDRKTFKIWNNSKTADITSIHLKSGTIEKELQTFPMKPNTMVGFDFSKYQESITLLINGKYQIQLKNE